MYIIDKVLTNLSNVMVVTNSSVNIIIYSLKVIQRILTTLLPSFRTSNSATSCDASYWEDLQIYQESRGGDTETVP